MSARILAVATGGVLGANSMVSVATVEVTVATC